MLKRSIKIHLEVDGETIKTHSSALHYIELLLIHFIQNRIPNGKRIDTLLFFALILVAVQFLSFISFLCLLAFSVICRKLQKYGAHLLAHCSHSNIIEDDGYELF